MEDLKEPKVPSNEADIEESSVKQFNIAFVLMTIIPFLVFFYILIVELFSIEILTGNIGLVLLLSIFLAVTGYGLGYKFIKKIINKIIQYASIAKSRDEQKSEFVAFVSHELKTPLSIMKLNLINLDSGFAGKITGEQKSIISNCNTMIERMTNLIKNMLDLYKIQTGMTGMDIKRCDIAELVKRQLEEFAPLLEEKHIILNKDIMENVKVCVKGDSERLTEVINNLVGNAYKHSPRGGRMYMAVCIRDGNVRFEVKDSGPGIPKEKLRSIFNKFEKLDNSADSTGLGLTIAKEIIEKHEGKIWVESESGAGSKFVFTIPAYTP